MKKTLKKSILVVMLAGIAMLVVPILAGAGSLEPSAAPAPTMKTLDEIPPTWSQILPSSERFVRVLNNFGVLDKETGLVWEYDPTYAASDYVWSEAMYYCDGKRVGDKGGWRLPTRFEVTSLTDDSGIIPRGIFYDLSISDLDLWTATEMYDGTDRAVFVFVTAGGGIGSGPFPKSTEVGAWCVRGGGH